VLQDWEQLMLGLEESRLELESVWSSVNLLNIVTDKLEMDRFAQVNLNTVVCSGFTVF
jgi:hypothetical protein